WQRFARLVIHQRQMELACRGRCLGTGCTLRCQYSDEQNTPTSAHPGSPTADFQDLIVVTRGAQKHGRSTPSLIREFPVFLAPTVCSTSERDLGLLRSYT